MSLEVTRDLYGKGQPFTSLVRQLWKYTGFFSHNVVDQRRRPHVSSR